MGYKPWRSLSVLVALGACMVGCTNGPQKSTGLGANNANQMPTKQQLAQQQPQQLRPGDAQWGIQPQKGSTALPPFPQNPQTQQSNSQSFSPNSGVTPTNVGGMPSLPDRPFAPMPSQSGSSSIQPATNSIGGIGNAPAPTPVGSFAGDRTIQPVPLQGVGQPAPFRP